MRLVLNLASALAAFIAAWFWWTASRQPPPTSFALRIATPAELDEGFQNWIGSSARANKRAASFTAVAAALQGVASVVS